MLPLSGWSHCKPITVQHAFIDTDLSDFPFVAWIDGDTDLGAHALANGHDIRFTAADGVTLLDNYRIHFDITAGAATGRWKVGTDVHAAGGDVIYIHYGNAAAPDVSSGPNAHDANFKAVIEGDDSLVDVTGNGNNGTKGGTGSVEVTGPIWKAQHLNGTDDYINCGHGASLTITGGITYETLVKFDAAPLQYKSLGSRDGNFRGPAYATEGGSNNWTAKLRIGGAWVTLSGSPISVNTTDWYHFAFKYISGTFKILLNGAVVASNAQAGALDCDTSMDLVIGSDRKIAGRMIDGRMAESRLSNISRSDAWIKFTYRNITEADHEQTWGAEEAAPTGPSIPIVQHHLRMMRGA